MMNLNYVETANNARINNSISTIRNKAVMIEKRRTASCKALVRKDDGTIEPCGCTVEPWEGVKVLPFGNGNAYGVTWCNDHNTVRKHMASYSTENNIIVGKATNKGVSVSLEIEMDSITDEACATLEEYKVLMTSDASVDVEGKI